MSDLLSKQRVGKGPDVVGNFKRRFVATPSARFGIETYLRSIGVGAGDGVLLPAYVGWSAREGSGIYDPLQAIGARTSFYRVDRSLQIDLEDFERVLDREKPEAVLLVHYFGMPDPNARTCALAAKERGVRVLEDEAHAMLSDLIGGVCGRDGDAAVFSLHKLLPFSSGGMLVSNGEGVSDIGADPNPFEYDLFGIAAKRRENALKLFELVNALGPEVSPLWSFIPNGVVPQSLPVLIHRVSRDVLYERFNDARFGGTSLYYAMIEPIDAETFPDSHWISKRIFNLPVHQDVDSECLAPMVECLAELARA